MIVKCIDKKHGEQHSPIEQDRAKGQCLKMKPIKIIILFAAIMGSSVWGFFEKTDTMLDPISSFVSSFLFCGWLTYIVYYIDDFKRNFLKLDTKINNLAHAESTLVNIIKPKNKDDFYQAFQGATQVKAYNPPLTLLRNQESHRNIIHGLLMTGCEYRMIVGNRLIERVQELSAAFHSDHKNKKKKLGALENLKIVHCVNHNDLHSEIDNWELMHQKDLRGFCFFLIKAEKEKRILLYLLGEPFVKEFDVPAKAILIVQKEDMDMFNELESLFDTRWDKVSHNNDHKDYVPNIKSFLLSGEENE